jgi:hypothetical protein
MEEEEHGDCGDDGRSIKSERRGVARDKIRIQSLFKLRLKLEKRTLLYLYLITSYRDV